MHQDANRVLRELPETDRERITETLKAISESRKLTDHPKCKVLNNNYSETLYKLKVGEYRALLELQKPDLRVLKLGKRQGFYDDIDGIYAGL